MTTQHFFTKVKKKLALFYGNIFLRPKAVNVLARKSEWDVLIILDGCRYDTFKKVNTLPGQLQSIISLGSCTPEWTKKALSADCSDIVYISANPFVSTYYLKKWGYPHPLYSLIELWDKAWDPDLKTVPAESVFSVAEQVSKLLPEKKLVLHCMQPHHPFIGKTSIDGGGWKRRATDVRRKKTAYEMLESGDIEHSLVLQAYEDNLRYILNVIKQSHFLGGQRVILTADHGNCFGEYGVYAHPEHMALKELLQVPWFILEDMF